LLAETRAIFLRDFGDGAAGRRRVLGGELQDPGILAVNGMGPRVLPLAFGLIDGEAGGKTGRYRPRQEIAPLPVAAAAARFGAA